MSKSQLSVIKNLGATPFGVLLIILTSKYPSKILKFKLFNFIIFAIAVVICF